MKSLVPFLEVLYSYGMRTDFLIDPNQTYQQVLQEREAITGTLLAHYTYGKDLLFMEEPAHGRSLYLYDASFSTGSLLSGNGNISSYEYNDFGQTIAQNEFIRNPSQYSGEYFDKEFSSLYLRARYYSPNLGQFLTMDPLQGIHTYPQSWHRYRYCLNNPLNCTDASGKLFNISSNLTASAVYGHLASIALTVTIQGVVAASKDYMRKYIRTHPMPDAILVGIQYQRQGQAPGFELSKGLLGFEILIHREKAQAWFYLYFGVNFSGSCSFGGIGTWPIYLYGGVVWEVHEAQHYTGLRSSQGSVDDNAGKVT